MSWRTGLVEVSQGPEEELEPVGFCSALAGVVLYMIPIVRLPLSLLIYYP